MDKDLEDVLKTTIFILPLIMFLNVLTWRATNLQIEVGLGMSLIVFIISALFYFFDLKPSFLQPSIVDGKGRIIKKQSLDPFSPESPSNDGQGQKPKESQANE
jgi:hypothetical protein